MKKESTNLTVAVAVVAKAREIVARMPFKTSVAQLAEALLTEAFAAVEADEPPADTLPTITKLRSYLHKPDAPAKMEAPSPALMHQIDDAIRRILAEQETARAAEQPTEYITRRRRK